MTTSNFSVRLDENLREQATQVLASYGLSPTQAIKLFFNQIVATKKVPLSFEYQAAAQHFESHTLSANGERLLRESIADFENGNYTEIDDLNQLKQLIKA